MKCFHAFPHQAPDGFHMQQRKLADCFDAKHILQLKRDASTYAEWARMGQNRCTMVNHYATLHLNVTPEGPIAELHDMRTT